MRTSIIVVALIVALSSCSNQLFGQSPVGHTESDSLKVDECCSVVTVSRVESPTALTTPGLDRLVPLGNRKGEIVGAAVGGTFGAALAQLLVCHVEENRCQFEIGPVLAGFAIGAIMGAGVGSIF